MLIEHDDKDYEVKENTSSANEIKEYTKNVQFLPVFFFYTFKPAEATYFIGREWHIIGKHKTSGMMLHTHYISVWFKVTID